MSTPHTYESRVARPSVTEDSLAEAFRDQLTILLFMHVAFSFLFYAKQEFDVHGIGADRHAAFAIGAAPYGIALLAAFVYYIVPFEQMLARDVRSEAAGTKGESYSSHYKGESYRCPTKQTDVDGALETYELMSSRYFIHATPTLFNSGTNNPQMSTADCC